MDYPLQNPKSKLEAARDQKNNRPVDNLTNDSAMYQYDADSCINDATMCLKDLHSKPETFDEYLSSLPESVQKNLKKFTEHTRRELTTIRDTLEPQLSKPGFENKKHILISFNELILHWDTYIWKICEQLDFKNNSNLISNAGKESITIPSIEINHIGGSVYGYAQSLRPRPESKNQFDPKINVVLDVFKKPIDDASKLTEAVIHETLHAFLYTFSNQSPTNTFLDEGMTTILTDAIVGKNLTGYDNNFALIAALNKLDSNALRNWYTGVTTYDEYSEHIRDILSEYYSPEIVNPLIEKIGFSENMKNVELTRVNNHPFATEVAQINTIVETITKPEERYSR